MNDEAGLSVSRDFDVEFGTNFLNTTLTGIEDRTGELIPYNNLIRGGLTSGWRLEATPSNSDYFDVTTDASGITITPKGDYNNTEFSPVDIEFKLYDGNNVEVESKTYTPDVAARRDYSARLVDAVNESPKSNILIVSGSQSTRTDADGYFSIQPDAQFGNIIIGGEGNIQQITIPFTKPNEMDHVITFDQLVGWYGHQPGEIRTANKADFDIAILMSVQGVLNSQDTRPTESDVIYIVHMPPETLAKKIYFVYADEDLNNLFVRMESNNINGYDRMGRPSPPLPDINGMSNIFVMADTVSNNAEEGAVRNRLLETYDVMDFIRKYMSNNGFPINFRPLSPNGPHIIEKYFVSTRTPTLEAGWQEREPLETGMVKDVRWPDWLKATSWHNSFTQGGAYAMVTYDKNQEITDKVLTKIHDALVPGTKVELSGVTLRRYTK